MNMYIRQEVKSHRGSIPNDSETLQTDNMPLLGHALRINITANKALTAFHYPVVHVSGRFGYSESVVCVL